MEIAYFRCHNGIRLETKVSNDKQGSYWKHRNRNRRNSALIFRKLFWILVIIIIVVVVILFNSYSFFVLFIADENGESY